MRGRPSNNNNRGSALTIVGEGELSVKAGENKVNSKVQSGETGRDKVVEFGGENKTKPFCIRVVLFVDVYA